MSNAQGDDSRRGPTWVLLVLALVFAACAPADDGSAPPPAAEPDELATPDADGDLRVHFLDVGQGDATLLQAPDATVLVDTGRHERSDVTDHLDRLGVTHLDLVVVTHPHADHLGQFPAVLETVDVTEVWWSGAEHTTVTFERALDALEASDAAYEEPRAGDTTTVGSLRFDVVNPSEDADFDDHHDSGLAFRVTYGDVAFLFTGDAEAPTEQRMVTEQGDRLEAGIYQVGHHGSRTSTSQALLDAAQPEVAVWSAATVSEYGHPHDEVVERLDAAGVEIYGTGTHGTIMVVTDGHTYTVETERDPEPPDAPPPPQDEQATDLDVSIVELVSPVGPGSDATATVSTAPGAECAITVTYRSGPSQAPGLEPATAGDDGTVTWTWTVGTRAAAGEWPVDVTCSRGEASASDQAHLAVR